MACVDQRKAILNKYIEVKKYDRAKIRGSELVHDIEHSTATEFYHGFVKLLGENYEVISYKDSSFVESEDKKMIDIGLTRLLKFSSSSDDTTHEKSLANKGMGVKIYLLACLSEVYIINQYNDLWSFIEFNLEEHLKTLSADSGVNVETLYKEERTFKKNINGETLSKTLQSQILKVFGLVNPIIGEEGKSSLIIGKVKKDESDIGSVYEKLHRRYQKTLQFKIDKQFSTFNNFGDNKTISIQKVKTPETMRLEKGKKNSVKIHLTIQSTEKQSVWFATLPWKDSLKNTTVQLLSSGKYKYIPDYDFDINEVSMCLEYFDGLDENPGLYLVMQRFLINPEPIKLKNWRVSTEGSRCNTQKLIATINKDDCAILTEIKEESILNQDTRMNKFIELLKNVVNWNIQPIKENKPINEILGWIEKQTDKFSSISFPPAPKKSVPSPPAPELSAKNQSLHGTFPTDGDEPAPTTGPETSAYLDDGASESKDVDEPESVPEASTPEIVYEVVPEAIINKKYEVLEHKRSASITKKEILRLLKNTVTNADELRIILEPIFDKLVEDDSITGKKKYKIFKMMIEDIKDKEHTNNRYIRCIKELLKHKDDDDKIKDECKLVKYFEKSDTVFGGAAKC